MCNRKDEGGRCAYHDSLAAAQPFVPRTGKLRAYYRATDAKHFGQAATAVGSRFTDPKMRRVNDVVGLAWRQRPDRLDGDDRDTLIAMGADPAAFRPGLRYLRVTTPGTVGIEPTDGYPDDTPIRVVRTKPDTPATLVLDVPDQPTTDYATIIIGPAPDDPAREVVYTVHPGLPSAPATSDTFGHLAGQTTTLGEIRAVLGRSPWVNTSVTPPS